MEGEKKGLDEIRAKVYDILKDVYNEWQYIDPQDAAIRHSEFLYHTWCTRLKPINDFWCTCSRITHGFLSIVDFFLYFLLGYRIFKIVLIHFWRDVEWHSIRFVFIKNVLSRFSAVKKKFGEKSKSNLTYFS